MFNLYCDPKRQCDVADILNTARTLGFDRKYKIIYNALGSIANELNGTWIDFETFLTLITEKLVNFLLMKGQPILSKWQKSNVQSH